MAPLSLLLAVLSVLSAIAAEYIEYDTSPHIIPGMINVHLVPHTHDDVGWLKTVDQYYVGSNNSIQGASVQNVLDSVVQALLSDKNRKFIYVEQAFFQRWWNQQSDAMKTIVKELVSSGQLEFINGGMCMHDEATTHYIDMIDQTTLGHRFIKKEFNKIPRIGWQIDPFGHSAVQAYLLSTEVGFDALYFFRIDYQDKQNRKNLKNLETVWQGSKTFGSSSDIFTGIFPNSYQPPTGFHFEVNDKDPIVQDDINLFDYNVQERVNDFVETAMAQANITRTNHIMWTMGTDFMYQYANTWFRQMDKLIHYVKKDGRVNALYSTPSIYTDAKYAANESWPLKTGDFFPYADQTNAYWTGYFTSRPSIKGYVRSLSAYYLASRQLEFLMGRIHSGFGTDSLADALAIAQHHDAVTGTEKQHVANDYAKRLAIGYTKAEKMVGLALASLSESSSNRDCHKPSTKFEQCPLLNITYCPASEVSISDGKSKVVLVYNSLGWKREEIIRIPVFGEHVTVKDSDGRQIEAQLLPIDDTSLGLRSYYVQAYLKKSPTSTPKFWLAFSVSVPPLGFSTYFVSLAEKKGMESTMSKLLKYHGKIDNIEIGQGNLKLFYNGAGILNQYFNNRSLVKEPVEQSYNYYTGDDGLGSDPQADGAYIFRPNGSFPIRYPGQMVVKVMKGPILDEIHQSISPWIYQITRVYKDKEHAEIEFIVGPIPVSDEIGKEVATQITTTMLTNKTFYTDSNGRDFIKRIRDYRSDWDMEVNQPVAGNYYPINLGVYIEDDSTELSLLVDRSVGGSSLVDGQIELMLHRRLLFDDGRGVGEALNETVCVDDECSGLRIQGKFYFRIDPLGEGAKWRRSFGQEIYSPLLLAFSEQDGNNWEKTHLTTFSAIKPSYNMPENVAIITLQTLEKSSILFRLAHLYEVGEDSDLSVMAQVQLRMLFHDKKISTIREMNLSANQERSVMEKKRLVWKSEDPNAEKGSRGSPVDPSKLIVELAPMEIRTFIIEFDDAAIHCS